MRVGPSEEAVVGRAANTVELEIGLSFVRWYSCSRLATDNDRHSAVNESLSSKSDPCPARRA